MVEDRPVKPYAHGLRHHETGFRLYWGGHNPLPYFVASGEHSQRAADCIRDVYPLHRVTRADVAEDFDEAGGFDRVVALIEPIARQAGVEVCFMGDPDPSKKTGRTMYYGSTQSDVRICLYEKGLHERSQGNLAASETWCRLELRVRPRKQRKGLCASMSPADMWGLSRWSSQVSASVLASVCPFQPDPSLRLSTADQAVGHMLRQYAGSIRRFIDEYGEEQFFRRVKDAINA